MDSDFERFRIDPAVRDTAAQACARLGIELSDVLRALVARIARDGRIPFDLGSERSAQEPSPLPLLDAPPWTALAAQVEADVLLAVLARFIADCSTRIDEQSSSANPDRQALARLTESRDNARASRRTLDVTDREAVRAALRHYGPLVAAKAP